MKTLRMMKAIAALALVFLSMISIAKTQNFIPIPDTLSGTDIYLTIADSTQSFYPGFNTATIAYNGRYLGPTILLDKDQNVNMHVINDLADTTTTHWHGLHVAPMNDGSPHNPIQAGDTWLPSFTVLDHAATYWYHPHLHGKTMDQVLKGAAGLIIVRDSLEAALALPRTYGVDDIPLVCQFQTIDNNTKQIVLDDELDNTTMVNGTVNPMVNVPAQVVRLRLLNASSHRVLQFAFNDGRTFHQITSDDGLLDAPVPLTRLRLGSGERAEILVDFTGQSGNTYSINQFGGELPAGYPGGPAMMGNPIGPLDNTTFNFLQINVVAQTSNPITTIPTALTTNTPWLSGGASTMNFQIQGSPMMSMTNFTINGTQYDENVINFTKNQDDIMIWNITNQSMMAHPFHIHGNHFFILTLDGATPPPNLQGRKDVVLIGPQGGSARIITKYADFADTTMPYMYHCHILSHEDKGMMGQFLVTQAATGCCDGAAALDVAVYPNPAQHFVKVALMDPKQEIQKIEVFDMLGRLLEEIDGGTSNLEISTVKYQSGTYILKVYSQGKCVSRKIQRL